MQSIIEKTITLSILLSFFAYFSENNIQLDHSTILFKSEPENNQIKPAIDVEKDWTGTYVDKSGNSLTIKGPDKTGAIEFKILQANADCEGSEISAVSHLTTSDSFASFSDNESDCGLTFTYNSNYIDVKETSCDYYHGENCGLFDGRYKKK